MTGDQIPLHFIARVISCLDMRSMQLSSVTSRLATLSVSPQDLQARLFLIWFSISKGEPSAPFDSNVYLPSYLLRILLDCGSQRLIRHYLLKNAGVQRCDAQLSHALN